MKFEEISDELCWYFFDYCKYSRRRWALQSGIHHLSEVDMYGYNVALSNRGYCIVSLLNKKTKEMKSFDFLFVLLHIKELRGENTVLKDWSWPS